MSVWRCAPRRFPGPVDLDLMHALGAIHPFLLYMVAVENTMMKKGQL
jgi:hypothetical protein